MSDKSREQVKRYWESQHEDGDPDTFLDHPMIQAYVAIRSCGDLTSHQTLAVEAIRSRTRPGSRILSVGCGGAEKEMHFVNDLPDRHFVGLDLAESALERARQKIEVNGVKNLELVSGDFNDLSLDANDFDVVLGSGAIHHIENLEGFWAQCRHTLRPGGIVVGQEYVGPNRFQWTDVQCEIGTALLREHVPAEHKAHHDRVEPIPLAVIIAEDPSEAVRSEEILSTLEAADFKIVEHRGAGCGLLQPMLMYQMHTFDPSNWAHNRRLAELFAIEQRYLDDGTAGDAYAMFVAEP